MIRALAAIPLLGLSLFGAVALPAATPANAVDTIVSKDAPDLTAVRDKIKAENWSGAIGDLNGMIGKGVQHPDVFNLLGYSLRKSGDTKQAQTFYKKALEFDPTHRGALEYLGELYVEIGDLPKAREHVVLLRKLCPQGCEELADLEQHITAASAKTN